MLRYHKAILNKRNIFINLPHNRQMESRVPKISIILITFIFLTSQLGFYEVDYSLFQTSIESVDGFSNFAENGETEENSPNNNGFEEIKEQAKEIDDSRNSLNVITSLKSKRFFAHNHLPNSRAVDIVNPPPEQA